MLLAVPCEIQVGLIETTSLKVGIKRSEDGSGGLAGSCILLEVGLGKDQVRAEAAGYEAWHGCPYAKLTGVVVGCAHHANPTYCHTLAFLQTPSLE